MPATFAHPALAWPLRRWLPWRALVVGSTVPDVAHLLPRRPWTDHTLLSVVTFALPLGVLVLLTFERLAGPALAAGLPAPWRGPAQARLARPRSGPGAVLGILGGALGHVALDALTHPRTLPVRALPALRASVWTPFGPEPVHVVLQHGLGVAGTALLGALLLRWMARHRAPERLELLGVVPWALALLGVGAGAVAIGHRNSWWLEEPTRTHVFLVEGAAAGMMLSVGLAVAYGVAWHVVRWLWSRRVRARPPDRPADRSPDRSAGPAEA